MGDIMPFLSLAFVFHRLTRRVRSLPAENGGSVAIVIALIIFAAIGMIAMAVDVSLWSSAKNAAQGAADDAALSAVVAASAGDSATRVNDEALGVAALHGYTNGVAGVTVTLYNPPTSGNYANNSSAYEVVITQPQTLYFARLLGNAPTVVGRSVGLVSAGPPCILSLDTSAQGAVNMSSGATTATNCIVAANSSNSQAVVLQGSGVNLTAPEMKVAGNYSVSNGATMNVTTVATGTSATTPDPYANLSIPTFSGCDHMNYSVSNMMGMKTVTLNPGVYCNGLSISGKNVNVTMNPGTYIINSGSFDIGNGATVSGSGVCVVLTSTSNSYGTVGISGSTVTLTPPSSGSMQGVAICQDRRAPSTGSNTINGGSAVQISGSLYFPSQTLSYSANNTTGSACSQLIADKVNFTGSAGFGVNCGSLSVPGLQSSTKGIPAE